MAETWKLVQVDGGLNTRVGEEALQLNETPFQRNWELSLGGGLSKAKGFEEIVTLPFPIQGLLPYTETGSCRTRILAYAFPEIFEVDVETGNFNLIPKNISTPPKIFSDGDPFILQFGTEAIILDGVNVPTFFDGNEVKELPTWRTIYSVANNSIMKDINALNANPSLNEIGNPAFGAVYQERAFLSGDSKFPRRVYFSKPQNFQEWRDNTIIEDVPIDTPGFFDLEIANCDITALVTISDALIIFTTNEIFRMTGKNIWLDGLPDQWRIEKINSQIGCLNQHLAVQQDKSDIYFYSRHGLYTLKLADNFGTVRPGGLSYPIQKDLDQISTGGMKRAKMINNPAEGVLYMATPKLRTHRFRDKLWKLNYSVNPQTNPWSVFENFGFEARIDSLVTTTPNNLVYISNYDKVFKLDSGTSFFPDSEGNATEIQATYDFRPIDFGEPRNNKTLVDFLIKYRADVDSTLLLSYAWDTGEDGLTTIFLPKTLEDEFGVGAFDDSGGEEGSFTSAASLATKSVVIPVAANAVGRSLKVRIISSSDSIESLEIFEILISYVMGGPGA